MSAFSTNATWYLMRSSGVVALVLLTAVVVLGIATNRRWRPTRMPRVVTAALHRTVSLLAVAFLGVHVVTAAVDPYAVVGPAAVIVPFVAGRSALWVGLGALSLDIIAALIVSSLLRARVSPRLWRGIHWLAYLAWPLALAHSFGSGTDASSPWLEATGAVCIASVVAGVLWRISAERGAKHLEPRAVTA
jgi:methionine sulfoxide reductase heme-binding subunit